MKKIKTLVCLMALAITCSSQDLITKKDGTDIKAKIVEIGFTDIKYKNWDNQNGPSILMLKSDILIVRYQNGQKEIFNAATTQSAAVTPTIAAQPVNYKLLGQADAERYFKGYRGARTIAFWGSVVAGPIIGVITPVVNEFVPVKEKRFINDNKPELFNNPEYYNAYSKKAKKIKSKKTWGGYLLGGVVSIGVTTTLILMAQ